MCFRLEAVNMKVTMAQCFFRILVGIFLADGSSGSRIIRACVGTTVIRVISLYRNCRYHFNGSCAPSRCHMFQGSTTG